MTIHITTKRYDIKIETVGNYMPNLIKDESLLNMAEESQLPSSDLQDMLERYTQVERVTVEDYLPFPKSIS